MLSDDVKKLHELIRELIDVENAFINNKYSKANFLLANIMKVDINEFFLTLRREAVNKLYEMHGDNNND